MIMSSSGPTFIQKVVDDKISEINIKYLWKKQWRFVTVKCEIVHRRIIIRSPVHVKHSRAAYFKLCRVEIKFVTSCWTVGDWKYWTTLDRFSSVDDMFPKSIWRTTNFSSSVGIKDKIEQKSSYVKSLDFTDSSTFFLFSGNGTKFILFSNWAISSFDKYVHSGLDNRREDELVDRGAAYFPACSYLRVLEEQQPILDFEWIFPVF